MAKDDDRIPISGSEARQIFAAWKNEAALVLAVSGGPDSTALMWLAARWRNALKRGPQLIAVTVDHGLRTDAAREARQVKQMAKALGLDHRTMRWRGDKPLSGIQAAAREARYRLLTQAARGADAAHILTAHTRDDQAETFVMRMSRGSGISGLAAMARQASRDGITIARPLLDVSKTRLLATLEKANVPFVVDPTNRDTKFARPRLRMLMPLLAAEGADARGLSRLAARLARADMALDIMTQGAERYLRRLELNRQLEQTGSNGFGFDLRAFSALAEELRVRLMLRAIDRIGHEGPAELGKVEALVQALDRAATARDRFRQTLAGASVAIARDRILVTPAPPRRS